MSTFTWKSATSSEEAFSELRWHESPRRSLQFPINDASKPKNPPFACGRKRVISIFHQSRPRRTNQVILHALVTLAPRVHLLSASYRNVVSVGDRQILRTVTAAGAASVSHRFPQNTLVESLNRYASSNRTIFLRGMSTEKSEVLRLKRHFDREGHPRRGVAKHLTYTSSWYRPHRPFSADFRGG